MSLDRPMPTVLIEAPDPLGLNNVFMGIVIGVTTAILLGLGEWFRSWIRHRVQIKFVRTFIIERFTTIRDAKSMSHPQYNTADSFRWTLYQAFLRDLEVMLLYRLTTLSHVEIYDLQSKFAFQKEMFQNLSRVVTMQPLSIEFYKDKYAEFQQLKWLALPSHLFS